MKKDKIMSMRWITLAMMGLAIMITGLQSTMVSVGLDSLQVKFEADGLATQWFLNSYTIAFVGFVLLMGALGEKYGRKIFLNLGLLTIGAGSLWAIAATTTNEFIATQALIGVGAAMLAPQALSILVNVFKKKERALAISIWAGLGVASVALGPLAGGLLLERYSVSSLFYFNLVLALVVLIVSWFSVPESKGSTSAKLDIVGTVLSLTAVVALVLGFIWVPEHGWVGLYTLGAFATSIVTGLMFLKYQTMVKTPLLNMKYLKDKEFVDGAIGIGVLSFNLAGILFIATQFLSIVQQKTDVETGLLLLPMTAALALAAIVGYKLAVKFGNTRVMLYGITTTVVSMLLVSLWSVASPDWVISVTLCLVGLGVGLASAPAVINLTRAFNDKNIGMGSSVYVLLQQVFGAVGIVALGSVLNSKYSDILTPYVTGAPQEIADQILSSIGGAYEVATDFATQGQQAIANSVITTVNSAFLSGMATALAIAAIVSLVVAVNISRNTPKN